MGGSVFRGRCHFPGCNKKTAKKDFYKGKWYYDRYCCTHNHVKKRIKGISEDQTCELCGWIGPCDVHRKKPGKDGGKYRRGNMMIICPNCHRLIHYKEFKSQTKSDIVLINEETERLLFDED
ncbi:MAG: HNH endonuclease [Sphaerochaeta sp.]|jgi:hypothetical protein|nr:HNH endonuclease [Dehalococcoidia bacterium]MCK9597957.1 HNH endonuclease [Sphaerochaeta sp.]